MTQILDTLLESLFDKYEQILNRKENRHLSRFESDPKKLKLRCLKGYLIKTEINGSYHRLRKIRRKAVEVEVESVTMNSSMVNFIKHLNNGRTLKRNASAYYDKLQSLYMSLNYYPAVAYLESHDLELLLNRMVYAWKNLSGENNCTTERLGRLKPFVIRLLDDLSRSGMKLTYLELFRLLRMAAGGSDTRRLKEIYGQFLDRSTIEHQTEFFSCFLNASIPLAVGQNCDNGLDIPFALRILQDMCQSDITPDRLTDYLLLRLGSAVQDKILVIETIEHLTTNYHLDVESVQLIVDSLLGVDEYEFAHSVMIRYMEGVSHDEQMYKNGIQEYRINVRLIDYVLKQQSQSELLSRQLPGFLYKVDFKQGIVDSFSRYFTRVPRTPYMAKEQVKLEQLVGTKAFKQSHKEHRKSNRKVPAAVNSQPAAMKSVLAR
ncbi:hypothetical protein FOA43_001629 [Brettanomyces nanus]|uniref:Uncharacterized protein n=1 Tax=Eeniella nana TaxID=13502 RepID=A0A875S068_EENNA|nr:uncharacterized protein FOA43_001629 [Brettanomyces nanus]QPG74303.1 hypothetical protein FOA43_001629 [Brettanomyces nanus]